MKSKITNTILGILPLIVMAIMEVMIAVPVMVVLIFVNLFHKMPETSDEAFKLLMSQSMPIIEVLFAILSVIVFGLWYKKSLYTKQKEKTFDGKKNTIKFFIVLFISSIIVQLILHYAYSLVKSYSPIITEQYEESLKLSGLTKMPLILLLEAALIGPIGEELIFRGLTLGYFSKCYKFYIANILQALLFAIAHKNVVQASYTFFIGLYFGYIARKNINRSIIAHMIFNFVGIMIPLLFGS